MLGFRGEALGKHTNISGLANLNAFYNLNTNYALGLELNNEISKNWRLALTPQLHANFTDNLSLQIGAGPSWLHNKRRYWTVGGRLIFTF